jgi:predicted GNAT family N-acyltransferase
MATDIRLEKSLTDEEHFALFGWGENIFGVEDKRFSWRPKDWHFIVEEDGHVLSHVGVMETSVRVGENDIKVGGIGGVVSVPEAQGRGNIRAAMSRAAEFMHDKLQVEFGMLFCLPRLVPFYARQNWQLLSDPVEFEQPSGNVISPFHSMVLPFDNRAWPAGEIKVGGLPW